VERRYNDFAENGKSNTDLDNKLNNSVFAIPMRKG
jgi:hypothetical protein